MSYLQVYIVRHGETDANRQGIIQGQLDTDLNDAGRQQAEITGEYLKDVPFTYAFSSDSRRAVDTAKAILKHHPGVTLVTRERMRERDMGAAQGKTRKQIKSWDGLEPLEKFVGRALDWWALDILSLLPSHASELESDEDDTTESTAPTLPINILAVSHGAWIAQLVNSGLVRYLEYAGGNHGSSTRVLNTSITRVEVEADGTGSVPIYAAIGHLLRPVVKSNADDLNEKNDEDGST